MNDVTLSNEEVNELLNNDNSENKKSSPKGMIEEVNLEEIAAVSKFENCEFPVLERIHERLAKRLVGKIYDLISREVEIEVGKLKVISYDEYTNMLSIPTSMHICRFHPLRGKALIAANVHLVYELVENYFGGNSTFEGDYIDKEFTRSETQIMELFMTAVAKHLEAAWAPIKKMGIEIVGYEVNPQLAAITASSDIVLVTEFTFMFNEVSQCKLDICIPYTMLEPIRDLLDLGASRSDDEIDPNWVNSVRNEILNVSLNVSSVLANKEINLSEVKDLKVGDVIPIELTEFVTVFVENTPHAQGSFGSFNDKNAIRITEIISNKRGEDE